MKTRTFMVVVVLVAIVGLVIAYLLIPSPVQMADALKKDKYFSKSLLIYEKLYRAGDRSAEVVGAMVELYLQNSKVNEAVGFLEEYVKDHPNDPVARKQMGILYQWAQRPDDYLNSLEILNKIAPDRTTLREIARVYNYYGLREKQLKVLEQLVKFSPPSEDDVVDLAFMYIDRGASKDAGILVNGYLKTAPKLRHIRNVEFFINYLYDHNQQSSAVKLAVNYLRAHRNPGDALRLADRLSFKKNQQAALDLIHPFKAEFQKNPQLLALSIELKIALNRDKEAYADLRALKDKGTLPPALLSVFLELAEHVGTPADKQKLVASIDASSLPEDAVVVLAEGVFNDKQPDRARMLRKHLGNIYLKEHPAIAAMLSLAIDGKPTPAELERVALQKDLTPILRLRLATMYLTSGLKKEALVLARQFKVEDNYHNLSMYDLATLFVGVGEEKRGKQIFDRLHQDTDTQGLTYVDNGWALLTVASGEPQIVEAWISSQTKPELLSNLYFLAMSKQHKSLALKSAQLLDEIRPNKESAVLLADALVLNGKYEKALPVLRKMYGEDKKYGPQYLRALAQALKHSTQQDRAGLRAELDAYTKARQTNMSEQESLEFGYSLLGQGLKEDALVVFTKLAEKSEPDSENIKRLVYLWGPRPSPDKIAWMWTKTRAANGPKQMKWLEHLIYFGQDEQFITEFNAGRLQVKDPKVHAAYLEALIGASRHQNLPSLIKEELKKPDSAKQLTKLVDLARSRGRDELAISIMEQKVKLSPDQQTYGELAILALDGNRRDAAKDYFTEYFKYGGNDFQKHYFFAELLQSRGDQDLAKKHFQAAETLFPTLTTKSIDDTTRYAALLIILGKKAEARQEYAELYKKYPENKRIQVAYSHMLMDDGLFDDAKKVLYREKE